MTIEATLLSIDSTLKALLAISGVRGLGSDTLAAATPATLTPPENVKAGEVAVAAAGLTQAQAEPLAKPAAKRGRPAKPVDTAPLVEPTVTSAVDFLSLEPVVEEQPISLEEVRAALAVVQARLGQAAAVDLFKKTTGLDTLAKLTPDKYGDLFKAALPANRIAIEDVRSVLVKANERVANSGLKVLNDHGAKTIGEVTPDKFVKVILAAHAAQ